MGEGGVPEGKYTENSFKEIFAVNHLNLENEPDILI